MYLRVLFRALSLFSVQIQESILRRRNDKRSFLKLSQIALWQTSLRSNQKLTKAMLVLVENSFKVLRHLSANQMIYRHEIDQRLGSKQANATQSSIIDPAVLKAKEDRSSADLPTLPRGVFALGGCQC
jgi:hypothetical protein